MPTPERFTILIEGRLSRVRERAIIDHSRGLAHYLSELLTGTEIPESVWAPYGLRVTVEEDMDQGD